MLCTSAPAGQKKAGLVAPIWPICHKEGEHIWTTESSDGVCLISSLFFFFFACPNDQHSNDINVGINISYLCCYLHLYTALLPLVQTAVVFVSMSEWVAGRSIPAGLGECVVEDSMRFEVACGSHLHRHCT